MGEYACASFAVVTGVEACTVTGLGLNVGYFTEISCRKTSRSTGDALIGTAEEFVRTGRIDDAQDGNIPSSGTGERPASSRVSFFTEASSRMPPQHVRIVFQRTSRS